MRKKIRAVKGKTPLNKEWPYRYEGDTWFSFWRRTIKDAWKMRYYVYEFGPRYYLDQEYRNHCRSVMNNRKQKQKYGSAFLKNRPKIRARLRKRDGMGCNRCFKVNTRLTIDHIIPRVQGGTNQLTNLQLLCVPCHEEKTLAESAENQAAFKNNAKKYKRPVRSPWAASVPNLLRKGKQGADGTRGKDAVPRRATGRVSGR